MIVAKSQLSRFNDTINDDFSINLKQVCISIQPKTAGSSGSAASATVGTAKELLVEANVKLNRGGHYGLIGRNGVGKSVLMHSLANGSLFSVDMRDAVRVMLIRQSIDGDSDDSASSSASGKWTVERELKRKPFGLVEGSEMSELERWRIRAEQQSGARGVHARLMLKKLESMSLENVDTPAAIEGIDDFEYEDENQEDDDGDEEFADMLKVTELKKLLKQFRIPGDLDAFLSRPYQELSGGWKMRIQLVKALIYLPDLLLLDEPTNHLDIKGISWLRKTLKQKFDDVTILFVSHNKGFLNDVADNIVLFKNQKLEYFKGNYDTYIQAQEEKQLFNERMQDVLDRKKAHVESSVQRNLKIAHKQGDDKRLKQVAAKKYKLETRFGLERNSKGHRFKMSRDRPGYHLTLLDEVEHIQGESHQTRLLFNIPAPQLPRGTDELLQVEDVSFRRLGPDRKVVFELKNITFNVCAGQKIAILGSNGQGKSTLLNLMADSWHPTRGSINRKTAKIGYFQQNIVAEMAKDTDRSPLERLQQQYPGVKQEELWKHLGSFGLGDSELAVKARVADLSGGQRVALAFAELTYSQPSLLLLDEPNSHLDLDALEALTDSLIDFEGAVVFVSHDLAFVEQIATDYYWIADGQMKHIEGFETIQQLASK